MNHTPNLELSNQEEPELMIRPENNEASRQIKSQAVLIHPHIKFDIKTRKTVHIKVKREFLVQLASV